MGEGLFRTGIAFAMGNWLMRAAGNTEARLLVLLMLMVALLSAFMSSTGAVAILIPVVLSLAAKVGTRPSRLLMPMAFASLIGGMLTLIGTPPNLVASTQLNREGLPPFGFFDFTPVGLVILLVGIAYMLLVGRRLLPSLDDEPASTEKRRTLLDLAASYRLLDKLQRIRVRPDSTIAGQNVARAALRRRHGVTIIAVEPIHAPVVPVLTETELKAGAVLWAVCGQAELQGFKESCGVEELEHDAAEAELLARDLGLAEVLLTPQSELIGQTVIEARFRDRYNLSVIGIQRKGEAITDENIAHTRLEFGDSLLMAGGWKYIRLLRAGKRNFLVLGLPREMADVAPRRSRAPAALAILAAMLVLMGFKLVPAVTAVLLAASAAFATPVASPVNTLVLGPGGYRFMDFVRVGVPLQVVAMIITLVCVPLLFPF